VGKKPIAVYIIINASQDVIKVGISDNPEHRLATLQTGSPNVLKLHYAAFHSEAQRIETLVHHKLRSMLVHGEWFKVTPHVAQATIWQAAAEIGKPIAGSGYRIGPRMLPRWFWAALLVLIATGMLWSIISNMAQ
jgi:hypothetical protein